MLETVYYCVREFVVDIEVNSDLGSPAHSFLRHPKVRFNCSSVLEYNVPNGSIPLNLYLVIQHIRYFKSYGSNLGTLKNVTCGSSHVQDNKWPGGN